MIVGIDGGGTKVECVLGSDAGRILGRGIGGPVNTNFSTVWEVVQSFDRAIEASLLQAQVAEDQVSLVVVGSPTRRETLASVVGRWFPRAEMLSVSEGQLVLAAGGLVERGVAVISGTGSLVFARDAVGRTISVGGWGTVLGDDGSAYDIAVSALRAVCRADDGRGPSTRLTERILSWAQVGHPREIPQAIYGPNAPSRCAVAALAQDVAEAAGAGDAVAHDILVQAGSALADQVTATALRIGFEPGNPMTVVASGGVLMGNATVFSELVQRVQSPYPQAEIQRASVSPAIGGVAIGLRQAGASQSTLLELFPPPGALKGGGSA